MESQNPFKLDSLPSEASFVCIQTAYKRKQLAYQSKQSADNSKLSTDLSKQSVN